MPGTPPDGEPMPDDGRLEAAGLGGLENIPFGIYVHVPFCRTRCGYCDFNTYTVAEVGGGASRDYAALAIAEIRLPRRVLGAAPPRGKTGVLRGGTPTPWRPMATSPEVTPPKAHLQ